MMAHSKATSRPLQLVVSATSKSITTQILLSAVVLASLIAPTNCSGPRAGNVELARNQSPEAQAEAEVAVAGRSSTSERDTTSELDRFKRRIATSKLGSAAGKAPEFAGPIGNVSAVLGRDVRLVCTVENLGQHQVAWLKEETKTILSIDTNIIITNYRIFLIPDDEGRKWVLHIKDVQESDRGSYQCQINTNPMRSISGYLDVVVPPSLIETESTQVAEVMEHSNATLQCKASGHPRPSIGWRREDGEPIKLTGAPMDNEQGAPNGDPMSSSDSRNGSISMRAPSSIGNQNPKQASPSIDQQQPITHVLDVRSDRLFLTNVDRSMAGLYICTASNGIPSPASRQIPLYVKFAPKVTIPVRTISVNLGEQLDMDCLIEAFPKPTSYWSERQFIEPQPLPEPAQARLSAGLNQANNGMRLQRFGSSSPRWHQGHKFLMVRGASADASPSLTKSKQNSSKLTRLSSLSANNSRPLPTKGRQHHQQQPQLPLQKRQAFGGDDDSEDEWQETEEGNGVDNEPYEQRQVASVSNSSTSSWSSSSSNPDNKEFKKGLIQREDSSNNKAYVTVKQTALNPYTYKLKISIAKIRPNDLGEYVCTSSNSMGTSSARVFVKRADRNQALAAAVESTLAKPFSLTESVDNQAGYQRDGMGGQASQAIWNSGQFIQAQKSHRSPQSETRTSSTIARQSNRVYDENYLQSIRNRQSSNGFVISSSAFSTERNSADSGSGWRRANTVWLFVLCDIFWLGLLYF